MNGFQVGRTLFLEGDWPIGLHKVALKAPKLPSQEQVVPKKNRHSESVLPRACADVDEHKILACFIASFTTGCNQNQNLAKRVGVGARVPMETYPETCLFCMYGLW